jgi:hypothetical protein
VLPAGVAYRRAADTPSLSCAPAWAGPENCVVAWVDGGWGRTLLWARARVEAGSSPALVLGPVRAAGYATASPGLAWFPSRPDAPPDWGQPRWELVYLQGDFAAWSCRRLHAADAWDCGPETLWTGALTTPTLGSYADCDSAATCGTVWDPERPVVLGVAASSTMP